MCVCCIFFYYLHSVKLKKNFGCLLNVKSGIKNRVYFPIHLTFVSVMQRRSASFCIKYVASLMFSTKNHQKISFVSKYCFNIKLKCLFNFLLKRFLQRTPQRSYSNWITKIFDDCFVYIVFFIGWIENVHFKVNFEMMPLLVTDIIKEYISKETVVLEILI